MVFSSTNPIKVPAARGQSHPILAPLIAAIFALGLLLVPVIYSAATGTSDIPLFDPGKYTTEELATSTLNDGIPDVWKTWYGFSVIDSTVANADYTGSGIMNAEKYRLNIHPLTTADTPPQPAKPKVDPSKAATVKQAAVQSAPAATPEITKGDFSGSYSRPGRVGIDLYGFKLSASWGYVKDGKLGNTVDRKFNGWVSANGGGEIEVWSVEVNGVKRQFVELDASKKSHGIKQEVQNAAAGTYLLTWNHMGRSNSKSGDNAYFVKVYLTDGQNEITPSLVTSSYPLKDKPISKTQFEPQALAFTVKSEDLNPKDKPARKLWICFDCPPSSLNTYGTFIDDVRLTPVEIVQEGYNIADGIRFCRWLDAFHANEFGAFDNLAADKDRDRFRIKIAGNIPNITKANLKATDLHGAVIDGKFVKKINDGNYEIKMEPEGSAMLGAPVLLVSDGDDDKKYNGKGKDDGKDDQTLLADYDSKVIVTFPELNNVEVEFKASKAKGEIRLNVFYLSLDGNLPPDKRDAINLHLRKAREIYRQVATKVTVTNISPFTLPVGFAEYLAERKSDEGKVVETAKYLNPVECNKLIFEMRHQKQHPVPNGQILVTYIDAQLEPTFNTKAHGFVSGDSNPNDPPAVVSLFNNGAIKSDIVHPVTAHEVGHVLGVEHPGVITHLLMTDGGLFQGMTYKHNQRDSKRIRDEGFNKMKARKLYYAPLQ